MFLDKQLKNKQAKYVIKENYEQVLGTKFADLSEMDKYLQR